MYVLPVNPFKALHPKGPQGHYQKEQVGQAAKFGVLPIEKHQYL